LAAEFWNKAMYWMSMVDDELLPADHATKIVKLFDMAQLLQNGIILCNLANKISPKSAAVEPNPTKQVSEVAAAVLFAGVGVGVAMVAGVVAICSGER
jgi:hypothetical protein